MKILADFGINPILLGAQIVNFLIILYLLKRFAYKPIFEMLDKRKKVIEEGVKNAENSNKALERALEEEKKILKKAQTQAETVLVDAKQQAGTIVLDATDQAKQQVEKLLADAKKEIEIQTKETEKKLASQTTKLAIDILQKSLKGMFDSNHQKEVLEKAIKNLK